MAANDTSRRARMIQDFRGSQLRHGDFLRKRQELMQRPLPVVPPQPLLATGVPGGVPGVAPQIPQGPAPTFAPIRPIGGPAMMPPSGVGTSNLARTPQFAPPGPFPVGAPVPGLEARSPVSTAPMPFLGLGGPLPPQAMDAGIGPAVGSPLAQFAQFGGAQPAQVGPAPAPLANQGLVDAIRKVPVPMPQAMIPDGAPVQAQAKTMPAPAQATEAKAQTMPVPAPLATQATEKKKSETEGADY